jgi:hypothetical protein
MLLVAYFAGSHQIYSSKRITTMMLFAVIGLKIKALKEWAIVPLFCFFNSFF